MAYKRVAEASPPVLAAGAEDVHPAHPEQLALTERPGRDLVTGSDEKRELVLDRVRREPFLVRALGMAPVVDERVLEHLVHLAFLAGTEVRDGETVCPGRRRRLLVEVDDHAEERPDGLVPAAAEQAFCPLVRLKDSDSRLRGAVRARPVFDPLDDRRSHAAAERVRMHPAVAVPDRPPPLDEREPDERLAVEDEPPLRLPPPPEKEVFSPDELGLLRDGALEGVAEFGDRMNVLLGRLAELERHAGTSSSSTSGRVARLSISRVGSGSARSPSRFTQTVGTPSSCAGAMSWKRLAPTCTCRLRSACVRAKNSCQ